jgi:hypothetical protein
MKTWQKVGIGSAVVVGIGVAGYFIYKTFLKYPTDTLLKCNDEIYVMIANASIDRWIEHIIKGDNKFGN